MKKTGELLKASRENVGLTLSEVALATKINPKILTAIESGDQAALPAKTFLKGFVRSYALYLKMDVDAVMRSFVEDTGGPVAAPNHEAYQKQDGQAPPARRSVSEESSAGLRTVAVVVIVVLIGLIIGVRELVDKYQRERVAASIPADVKVSPLAEPKSEVTVTSSKVAPETATAATTATPSPAPVAKVDEKVVVKVAAKVEAAPAPKAKITAEITPAPETPVSMNLVETSKPLAVIPMAKVVASPLMSLPKILDIPITLKHEPASTSEPIVDESAKIDIARAIEPVALKPEPSTKAEPVVKPEPIAKAEPVIKAEPIAKVEPIAKPEPAKPANAAPVADGAAAAAPAVPVAEVAPVTPKNEVIIEALDKVDVKFQLAGEAKTVAMAPNDVQVIRADGAVLMDFSDGGAVNLVHNGRVRGVPGKLGEPKQVKYP